MSLTWKTGHRCSVYLAVLLCSMMHEQESAHTPQSAHSTFNQVCVCDAFIFPSIVKWAIAVRCTQTAIAHSPRKHICIYRWGSSRKSSFMSLTIRVHFSVSFLSMCNCANDVCVSRYMRCDAIQYDTSQRAGVAFTKKVFFCSVFVRVDCHKPPRSFALFILLF